MLSARGHRTPRLDPQEISGSSGDYDRLIAAVGNRNLVLIGEASHGTHDFYRERARITRRLIEEKGFRAVAVEADWPDAYRVNRYVNGAPEDADAEEALRGFRRFPTWMWRNAEVLEFVGWLRAHNDRLPSTEAVSFFGLDIYSLYSSIAAVIEYGAGRYHLDKTRAVEPLERTAGWELGEPPDLPDGALISRTRLGVQPRHPCGVSRIAADLAPPSLIPSFESPTGRKGTVSRTSEADRQKAYTSPTSAAPVLVGFDGEDGGRDALGLARLLCSIRDCGCVIAIPRPDLAWEAQTALEDVEIETRVIGVLSPAEMLVKCAGEVHAGTLVVGATRLDKLGRALVGTVAWHALREAPCEVVVAPRGYAAADRKSLKKIAVAVDGSEESKVAMTRAEDLAREAGAKFEVLVADDPIVSGFEAELPWDAPDSLSNVLEAALGSVDRALSPTGKRIDPGWHKVASTVAASIADACEADVDLLVTGSRRPMEQFLTGSVTKRLVGDAPCPVLVVPHIKQS